MQSNKGQKSFVLLWIFIFVCAISLFTSLFVAILFSDSLEEDKFKIDGFVVPKYSSTSQIFNVMPLSRGSISKRMQVEFTKNFLKEYIVKRYTVSGDNYNMDKTLGYEHPESLPNSCNCGYILKLPSFYVNDGVVEWTNAYKDFLKNDLPEIKALMESGITRSVKVLANPRKIDDWWVMKVEFIYRNPTTYSIDVAKKEKYEIKLYINEHGVRSLNRISRNLPAGNVFSISINDIQKIKL